MSPLHIDLLGENDQILGALRAHLLTMVENISVSPKQQINKQSNEASNLASNLASSAPLHEVVRIDCYANAKSTSSQWLLDAPSLTAPKRVLCLICPDEHAVQDETAILLWRSVIEESEIQADSTKSQSLQMIRGQWSSDDGNSINQATQIRPSLLLNATYAFSNILKNLSEEIDLQNITENNFRPLPTTLINYACEKCSDPECEHKLFGFLNSK